MQLSLSDLNLVYACTRDKTLMMDVQAREISEKDLEAALRLAHPEVNRCFISIFPVCNNGIARLRCLCVTVLGSQVSRSSNQTG